MSGGRWGYMDRLLWERGQVVKDAFDFLAAAEHELDWGVCSDTCLECAKGRVAEGLIRFFDGDVGAAIAVARDQKQHQCVHCIFDAEAE